MPPHSHRLHAAALLALAAVLSGCAGPDVLRSADDTFLGLITPYRMEIVQGNVLTREQLARVRPGMTRTQVRDVLGAPLLTSMFHADRWDYMFTMRRQRVEPVRRSVVVHFEGDLVKSIDAPELPSENEFVATIGNARVRDAVPVLELTEAQRRALPVPPPLPATPAEPVGPVRAYPPLEPR